MISSNAAFSPLPSSMILMKSSGTFSTPLPATMPQDSLLFVTGGYNGSFRLSSTETYPRSSDCLPPSLPVGLSGHTTFVTSDQNAFVATCGGFTDDSYTGSCLVLDPTNKRWDKSKMGSLTTPRVYGASATLNHIGVFIVGGFSINNRRSSEFLAEGQMQWQEGPVLPVNMSHPCTVKISPSSFLVIQGRNIREFDAAIAGPTSVEGWREAGRWPSPKTSSIEWNIQPGCAKVGQKVIITGGFNEKGLSSTEVLDLVNRQISSGGQMATPRKWFHVATITSRGEKKLLALAGLDYQLSTINTVEEWMEDSSTWKATDNLVENRLSFGAATVPKQIVCPL